VGMRVRGRYVGADGSRSSVRRRGGFADVRINFGQVSESH